MSPTRKLLELVWRHSLQGNGHSWTVLNAAMHRTLSIAIASGFPMVKSDWEDIYSRFRGGYWMSESCEWAYALAIRANNVDAYSSFEAWKNRKPFIADNVIPGYDENVSRCCPRERERLAVGFEFHWRGEKVSVTSFGHEHLIACSYKKGDYPRKIKARHRITIADIQADRAERKAKAKTVQAVSA